jgi:ubiquitin carboxyl-terminal hydrolase 36/42
MMAGRAKGLCMTCQFKLVLAESYKSRSQPITPFPVSSKLNGQSGQARGDQILMPRLAIAKHMRRGRQEDSHEFLRYFIDALQKSCLAGQPP